MNLRACLGADGTAVPFIPGRTEIKREKEKERKTWKWKEGEIAFCSLM